jgi:dephospho-CoA kinase
MYNLKGLILIESALFAEMGFCEVVNNNIVLLGCTPKVQHQRLLERGYNDKKIAFKNDLQFTTVEKKKAIENEISKSSYGHLFEINDENDGLRKYTLMFFVFLNR